MSDSLRFVDACTREHFAAMSRIHALGWHAAYVGHVPADYLEREITDQRWVSQFAEDYRTGRCRGLLLYRGDTPVGCINYGPARTENLNAGSPCTFDNRDYQGWGELISFYVHPQECGKGYGALLIEEAVSRLKAQGFSNVFVLVLRENEGARRFYARHGFAWDGTHQDIPFPPDAICVDLRYTRSLP